MGQGQGCVRYRKAIWADEFLVHRYSFGLQLASGNDGSWKSTTNGGFNGKINYKWMIFHCRGWLGEDKKTNTCSQNALKTLLAISSNPLHKTLRMFSQAGAAVACPSTAPAPDANKIRAGRNKMLHSQLIKHVFIIFDSGKRSHWHDNKTLIAWVRKYWLTHQHMIIVIYIYGICCSAIKIIRCLRFTKQHFQPTSKVGSKLVGVISPQLHLHRPTRSGQRISMRSRPPAHRTGWEDNKNDIKSVVAGISTIWGTPCN
jgi:hypothetical protein